MILSFVICHQEWTNKISRILLEISEKELIFAVETWRNPRHSNINKNEIMASTVLNEAQLSILRLLGSMKTVEEVDELRQVICDYYARRVDEEVDKLWESGQWNDEKNEAVLNEHLRTPYEYAK